MQLLLSCSTTAPGGIDRLICNLLNNLDYSRYSNVTLISFYEDDLYNNLDSNLNLRHIKISLLDNRSSLIRFIRFANALFFSIISCSNVVILNSHDSISFLLGFAISKLTRKQIYHILTVHQLLSSRPVSQWKRWIFSRIDNIALHKANGIIAVSEGRKVEILNQKKTPGEVKVIRNGVDFNTSLDSIKKKPLWNEKVVFGFAGRLSSEKGVDRLITAYSTLGKEYLEKSILLIAGSGPLQEYLSELISNMDLSENIKILGFQKNIKSFYSRINVLIQPSYDEGLSMTILEAMSMGISIIASNIPGNREALIDGYNGYLFDSNEELAEILKDFICNKEKIAQFGANGYMYCRREFNICRSVKETQEFLEEVVSS